MASNLVNVGEVEHSVWSVCLFSSVQFSRSVVSDSLRPHESQHARPPCPSPTPGVHSDSHPSSQWCHPAISSSVVPFSSCPQSLPAAEFFPVSQLFAWGGQSTGVSALASFLPKKSQGWSPSEWAGWISLQSKGLSTPQFKGINSSALSFLHSPTLTSIHEGEGMCFVRLLLWPGNTLWSEFWKCFQCKQGLVASKKYIYDP